MNDLFRNLKDRPGHGRAGGQCGYLKSAFQFDFDISTDSRLRQHQYQSNLKGKRTNDQHNIREATNSSWVQAGVDVSCRVVWSLFASWPNVCTTNRNVHERFAVLDPARNWMCKILRPKITIFKFISQTSCSPQSKLTPFGGVLTKSSKLG